MAQDTTFKVRRSKVKVTGGGHIVAASRLQLIIILFFLPSVGIFPREFKNLKNDVLGMTISPCSQRPANCCAVKLR